MCVCVCARARVCVCMRVCVCVDVCADPVIMFVPGAGFRLRKFVQSRDVKEF